MRFPHLSLVLVHHKVLKFIRLKPKKKRQKQKHLSKVFALSIAFSFTLEALKSFVHKA